MMMFEKSMRKNELVRKIVAFTSSESVCDGDGDRNGRRMSLLGILEFMCRKSVFCQHNAGY